MTRQNQKLLTIVAFAGLLVSPAFAGCEALRGAVCGTTDCPMEAPPVSTSCHGDSSMDEAVVEACDDRAMSIVCCAAPTDPQPASIDAPSKIGLKSLAIVLPIGSPSGTVPGPPPDAGSLAVSSRLHEVGRFTLLSSFLL